MKSKTVGRVEKRCWTCRKIKPLDEYHKNKLSRDKRQNQCVVCRREYYRTYYTLITKPRKPHGKTILKLKEDAEAKCAHREVFLGVGGAEHESDSEGEIL